MSTIKVDTIATRTGSGNITASNTIAGTSATLSGTLGVTGAITGTSQTLNRSGNGVIQTFQKDGSTIGQISGTIGLIVGTGDTGLGFQTSTGDAIIPQRPDTQAGADNLLSFGNTSYRFKDMYLGGGLYVGGTGAANKLDDYEEGTFTPVPVVTYNPGSVSISNITSQVGVYVKVGSMVFFHLRVRFDKSGTSGNIGINGMPFTANSIVDFGNIGMAREGATEGSAYQFEGMSGTQIGVIRKYDNTGFGTGTKDVQGHGFYRTDS